MPKYLRFTFLLLLLPAFTMAQTLEVINESPYTPDELIENVFLGAGIEILNVDYDGDPRSAAYFKGGLGTIGLDRGIIMTTGIAVDPDDNINDVMDTGNRTSGVNNNSPLEEDDDLTQASGSNTLRDITSYTITFRPLSDTVSFRYVFASEEYPEFVCSQFNDIFGFFISGPGINGPFENDAINLATIPGTTLPVRINTINDGGLNTTYDCNQPNIFLNNTAFFRDNNGSASQPIFDGLTTVFNATTPVQACEIYTIKLIIADVGDTNQDSGVFLEARSFGGEASALRIVNLAIDGTLIEGCQAAELHFFTDAPVEEDLPLVVDFFGDATAGVDYTMPPMDFVIPAGDSLLIVPIEALPDNIDDDGENIRISLQRSPCFTDEYSIRIESSRIGESNLIDRVELCAGEQANLDATLTESDPEILTFNQSENWRFGNLFNGGPNRFSTINVTGVVPEVLGPNILQEVCITDLTNNRVRQLSVYLINPAGNRIELTTRNGGGNNNAAFSGYENTCFRPDAVTRIAEPGQEAPASMLPFTGNWLPEGDFSELYFNNPPSNGQWQLQIVDNAPLTDVSRFGSWSMTFQRPYQVFYEWEANANLSCHDCPNPVLTAEQAGFIQVTARDIYGCEVQDSVEVVFPDFTQVNDFGCEEVSDTTITLSWSPAPGALRYEISGQERIWQDVGLATTFTFNNLASDSTYTFLVRGVFNACTGPAFEVNCRTLSCLTPPTLAGTPTDVTCFGANDGAISLSASGSHAPFRYEVNGMASANGSFSGLTPGIYEAVAFNDRGCTDTLNFTIREPQRNQASIQQSGSPACGNSFSLIALPSGGTAPYRYEWNGTLGDSILTDQTGGGTFSLRVIDANDCSVAEDITVVAPDPLLAPHASVPETCTGRTDGSITITPTGGTAPYSYDWGTVSTLDTNTVAGLSADAYTVTVADNDGCTFIVETTVGRGPDVQLSGDFTGASCFGDSNGRIELTTTQANAPLTYAWTGTNATSDLAEDLAAGDYSVTVTDDRGCVASQTFTITEPTVLSGSGMADNVLCFGENTGAITFAATGGTVPYRYTWNNGATTADPGSLTAGFYEVIVRDANDCLFTESFAVTENPALTAAFSIGEVSCNAGQDGQIAVAAGNGTPPYTYQWSFNNATTPQLTDVRAGFYEVQITDANGCSQNIQGEVTEPTALSVNPVIEPVRCFGETSGLIELDVNGGTPGYEFRLDGSTEWQRGNVFLGLDNGIYAGVVRDANGCIELVSNLEITEPELLTVDLGERQTVIWGENTQLGGRIRGGTPPVVEYSWTPVDTLAFSCQDCPTPFFTPNEQTTVTLRIIDEAGCVATDQITILVEKDFPVLVPTGFTPNNDQVNDVLIVHGRPDIQIEQFQVIDRWGEVIFQNQDFFTNDESAGWDGNYRDEPMVSGVYIWQAQVLYPDGKREKLSGETTLLR